ncbi:MAG: GNAT family N-acetyltransferase [Thermoanaerobaculia bacterium]
MIREATARDRDAILALRKRCFPDVDLERQEPAYWDWEFGQGRMFVAEIDGRIIAHLGFVPQTWLLGGEERRGMLAVDAMTDPDFRRQGHFDRVAAFARESLRSDYALSTAFQIRDAVLPGMQKNGWIPILRAPVLVKMLTFGHRSAGILPAAPPASSRLIASIASDFLSNTSHVHRSEQHLHWRFYNHDHYSIEATDTAYLITRRTTLRGYDTLAIADIGWRPGRTRDARVLLSQALARARAANVQLAAALLTLSHPALPALVRSGFLPSPHRFRFLVNVFDERIRTSRARWALTWADTDHL